MIIINNTNHIGKSITIINGKIIVDGKDVTPDSKEIHIVVNGNIDIMDVDYSNRIEIAGNVTKLNNGSGDVSCNDVLGSISSGSGNISCKNVEGDIKSGSGNVRAENVSGSVKTGSGNIKTN